jgi:hypothetical protein
MPSGLEPGALVRLVHMVTGAEIQGRVLSTYMGIGCRIRPVNDKGVTMATDHVLVKDADYRVEGITK